MSEDPTRTLTAHAVPGEHGPLCLFVIKGAPSSAPIEPGTEPLILGRADGVDVQLAVDGVSRKHAKITRSGDELTLIDLGAKNGTFLNGRRVDVSPLRAGDRIQIGQAVLRVGLRDEAVEAPNVTTPPLAAPVPSARAILSARELEVADLVAQGLTNAEIGRRLGIGRRTVATHLEHAYERLGIHSRAELARLVSAR